MDVALKIGGDQMLAENLKRFRLAKGWTQEDLTIETKPYAETPLRLGTVTRIENGGNTTTETLEVLAKALGVTAADLLSDAERAQAG